MLSCFFLALGGSNYWNDMSQALNAFAATWIDEKVFTTFIPCKWGETCFNSGYGHQLLNCKFLYEGRYSDTSDIRVNSWLEIAIKVSTLSLNYKNSSDSGCPLCFCCLQSNWNVSLISLIIQLKGWKNVEYLSWLLPLVCWIKMGLWWDQTWYNQKRSSPVFQKEQLNSRMKEGSIPYIMTTMLHWSISKAKDLWHANLCIAEGSTCKISQQKGKINLRLF